MGSLIFQASRSESAYILNNPLRILQAEISLYVSIKSLSDRLSSGLVLKDRSTSSYLLLGSEA